MEINQNQQNIQRPSAGQKITGAVAGTLVGSIPASVPQVIGLPILGKMQSLSKLSNDEFVTIENVLNQALKDTKLKEKGVEILRAGFASDPVVDSVIEKEVKNNTIAKFLSKIFPKKYAVPNQVNATKTMFAMGMNAGYLPNTKKIILPKTDLSLSGFHEIGHAMNANLSKVGNVLQKCRPLRFLAIPIMLIALLKTKKAPGEKPTGIIDKSTDFVKENAGVLTFASFMPTLIEEGMASLKGNKLATKLLNPSLAKKVIKTNKIAYLTYAAVALGSTAAVLLGRKVKDAIASNKVAKA